MAELVKQIGRISADEIRMVLQHRAHPMLTVDEARENHRAKAMAAMGMPEELFHQQRSNLRVLKAGRAKQWREACENLMELARIILPQGRYLDQVSLNIEEAMLWGNAIIGRD